MNDQLHGLQTAIADTAGERADVFLARAFPDFSRSLLQKLCKQGKVMRRGKPMGVSDKVALGDELTIVLPEQRNAKDIPPVEILYEDDDVIVLNKPTGMLSHAKGAFLEEATIADVIAAKTTVPQLTNRAGIVHRLDRATSGVMITAKNLAAQTWLQGQFSKRNVKKTYVALVKGRLKEPTALIQLPIERNPKKPQTFRVGGNGKPAETTYETLHEYTNATYVKLMPRTGRTHQLRVHMKYLGHPIVGDPVYGTPQPALGRMFLHAQTLELTLPSRERKVFTAPLPADLQRYLNSLT